MFYDNFINEGADVEAKEDDGILGVNVGEKSDDDIAREVEANMQQAALENVCFFENGEEALKEFATSEAAQAMLEARKMSKRTFVRLGQNDDLTRRTNMTCLILAREKKDPLFDKLAANRIKEREIRGAIYKKYGHIAGRIAVLSQKKHIKDMRKMKSLPAIRTN